MTETPEVALFARNRNIKDESKLEKLQFDAEVSLLKQKRQDCKEFTREKLNEIIEKLDFKILEKELNSPLHEPALMDFIFCLIDHITHTDNKVDGLSTPSNKQVEKWFSGAKRIGGVSVYGSVVSTSLGKLDSTLIIKYPKKKKNDVVNTHELFVGIFGTNKLKRYVPNFAPVLGGIKCSMPIELGGKRISGLCENKIGLVSHIIYKGIKGDDFRKVCKACTINDFTSLFMQEGCSLNVGWNEIKFGHMDLHDENVIAENIEGIKNLNSSNMYIPYYLEKKVIYIKASRVAVMIDFGSSAFDYRMVNYASYNWPKNTYIPNNRGRPLYDVFKLLGFCLYTMAEHNNPTFEQAKLFYKYFVEKHNAEFSQVFGVNSLDKLTRDVVMRANKTFYSLPLLSIEDDAKIGEYVEYEVKRNLGNLGNGIVRLELSDTDQVYGCQDSCLTTGGILEKLNVKFRDVEELHSKMMSVRNKTLEKSLMKKGKKEMSGIVEDAIQELKDIKKKIKSKLDKLDSSLDEDEYREKLDEVEKLFRVFEKKKNKLLNTAESLSYDKEINMPDDDKILDKLVEKENEFEELYQ